MRKETDWESKLEEGEFTEEGGKKMVFLHGLQRLAHQAGWIGGSCNLNFIEPPGSSFGVFSCIVTAKFDDGSEWVGTADANKQNTTDAFLAYPTAVAESRAEARALRKALNIRLLAYEEVGFGGDGVSVSPKAKIDKSVVRAINHALEKQEIDAMDAIEEALGAERGQEVFDIESLSVEEGQKLMSYLNKIGKSKRDKKKAELKKLIDE